METGQTQTESTERRKDVGVRVKGFNIWSSYTATPLVENAALVSR